MEKLISILREAHKESDSDQWDLSRLTGIPRNNISKIVAGEVDLGIKNLVALTNALDLGVVLVTKEEADFIPSFVRRIENDEKAEEESILNPKWEGML